MSAERRATKSARSAAEFEVAIVGGGPAGLTAGVWLGRYLHSVALIDGGDPRNWETRAINGYLGNAAIAPPELRGLGRDECRRVGVTLMDTAVTRVHRENGDRLRLVLGDGEVLAGRLLLAIGIQDVWPDVPGLERCYGETVHVCPDCDGYESRDKKTLVIGTGRKAVRMALALTTWTRKIVVCTNGEGADMDKSLCAKLDALNIPVLEARILGLRSAGGDVHTVELEDGIHLDCERVFFAIGQVPADDLGAQLSCARDENGLIKVDERRATSVPNVFAAGDITPGPQLAITAAADGAAAALAIHRSLLPEDRRLD